MCTSCIGQVENSTDFGYLRSGEKGAHEIVCDEHLNMNLDSFQVDMEAFSHLTNKDATYNSRFHLPRSLSRKGEEKKMNNPSVDNERDAAIFSPKSTEPQSHHQISITTTAATTETPTKSISFGKRSSSFKQTSIINPRRILLFFATLSSIGTIVLIYLTLSLAKHNKGNIY
ncbi:hypothetical protein M8C21_012611 [Ambrosia artemisiifolia]|uniref:Uncharacterized protein n=1 Tax=Ambrosia artemisiifolia TaxID=4212 RepID=A0AAD5CRZ3_AMBAR|nr:hypothetical protein M8C21_012611 [Ambrosia artemisiifolia]